VKQHLSAAFRALQVGNRTEAVYRAAELGIALQPRS
jgi:DNA-binding NarL/FixJ family response regulator